MPVDVEAEHLPLHPLSRRVREGEMPDAPSLPHRPPARRMLYRDLLLPTTPTLLQKSRTLAEQQGSLRSSSQRVEEASPDKVLQRVFFDGRPPVKVGDRDERLFAPLSYDGGDCPLGKSLAVPEANPESGAVFFYGEVFTRKVDIGREHAEPDPTRLIEEQPRAVETHGLGVENGGEELSRVVAPHVRARIGELREAGCVRGRETVDREALHPREDLVRFRCEDPVLPCPPHELQAQLPHRAWSPVLGHSASQEITLRQGEASDGVRDGEDLFLEDEDAVGGMQYFL